MKIVLGKIPNDQIKPLIVNYYNYAEGHYGKNILKQKSMYSLLNKNKLNLFLDAFDFNYHYAYLQKFEILNIYNEMLMLCADNNKILAHAVIQKENKYLNICDIVIEDKSFYDEVIIKNIYKLFLDFTEEFAIDNNMLHINVNLLDVDSLLSDVLFQKNYVFDETSDQNITFYKLIRNEKKVEGSNIYDITRRRNYTRK